MKSIPLLLLTAFLSPYLYAVDNLRLPDVRSIGMGGNGVTQSILHNPSLLVFGKRKSIHIEYFNRYSMQELGNVNASFQYPGSAISAGVHIATFGFDKYRENMVRLLLGKRLGEKWTLGIGIQYAFLQTELQEERVGKLSADIGATFNPVDNLLIGMLIMNMPSVSLGEKIVDIKDFGSYQLRIGFQWEIINNLLIMGSMGTDYQRSLAVELGIEYRVFDSFHFRAGLQTAPLLPSFGVGYCLSLFTVDVATIYHPVLGMSTGVGLSLSF